MSPINSAWVEPGVVLTFKGVTVYETYKNGDINEGARSFWFSLRENCGEQECVCEDESIDCKMVFDIRDLPGWDKNSDNHIVSNLKLLKKLIKTGILTVDGVKLPEEAAK